MKKYRKEERAKRRCDLRKGLVLYEGNQLWTSPGIGAPALVSAAENALEKGVAISRQCSQQLEDGLPGPVMRTWAGSSGSVHHSPREVSIRKCLHVISLSIQ